MSTTTAIEPEEAIEAALVALLATSCTIPVEGFLTPATEGTEKRLSADTFVSVTVDQTAMNLDYRGPLVPCDYSARIVVHCALADDADGSQFRDECRRVRAALLAITGDGCTDLAATGFACDEFMLDSTSSSCEGGENTVNTKAYSATLKGRITTATEA